MLPGFGWENLTTSWENFTSSLPPALTLSKPTALVLLLAGVVLLFAGKLLLKVVVGVGFGTLLAILGMRLSQILGLGSILQVLTVVVLFVIGFVAGWAIFKLSLSVVAGAALGLALSKALGVHGAYAILLVLVLIVLFYVIMERLLSAVAFIAGLGLIYISVSSLAGEPMGIAAALLALILYIIIRAGKRKR